MNHLTEEQKVAYSIAHNKLTMNTDFDLETLKYEINKLQNEEFDLSLLGFENIELEEILEEEEVLELEEEAEEKSGGREVT